MAIKKFKTKEEALAAMKKATDRKRTLIEYLKKGYSLEELEKMVDFDVRSWQTISAGGGRLADYFYCFSNT